MIGIASDHIGYALKSNIIETYKGECLKDLGPYHKTRTSYAIYANKMAEQLYKSHVTRGILICSTGIGMSICVNKHMFIRAALCYNERMAEMSRKHNNANILVLGASLSDETTAKKITKTFLSTEFLGGIYQSRIDQFRTII